MEWWAVLAFFIGGLIFLLLLGQPIAFAFLLMDVVAVLIFMGPLGLEQITLNIDYAQQGVGDLTSALLGLPEDAQLLAGNPCAFGFLLRVI